MGLLPMRQSALLEIRTSRLRLIEIAADLVLDMLKIPEQGTVVDGQLIKVESNPIPMDAEVVGCEVLLDQTRSIRLLIESSKFELLSAGAFIPIMCPTYHVESGKQELQSVKECIHQLDDIAALVDLMTTTRSRLLELTG